MLYEESFKILRTLSSIILDGRYIKNNTTEINTFGVFSKKIGKNLAMYAEGYRDVDMFQLICKDELYTSGLDGEQLADVILFKGNKYTVVVSHRFKFSSESLIIREVNK
jgi:hypothetical protein